MTPGALKFESSLMQIFDLSLRVKLNIQDELHKKRLLDALSLTDEYADLSGISEQHILFIIIGNGYLIFKGF
jgi:hypothetical protein